MIEHVGWTTFITQPESFIDRQWIPKDFVFKLPRQMAPEAIETLFVHIRDKEITDSDAEDYDGDYTTERFRLTNALTDRHKGRTIRSANYVRPTATSKKTVGKKGRKVEQKNGVTFRDLQGSDGDDDEAAGTDEEDDSGEDDEDEEERPKLTAREKREVYKQMDALALEYAKQLTKDAKAKKSAAREEDLESEDEEEEPPAKRSVGGGRRKSGKDKSSGRSGKSSDAPPKGKRQSKAAGQGKRKKSTQRQESEGEYEEDADAEEDDDSPVDYDVDRHAMPHLFDSDSPEENVSPAPSVQPSSSPGIRPPKQPVPAVLKASKPPPSTLAEEGTTPYLWLQRWHKNETAWQKLLEVLRRPVSDHIDFCYMELTRLSSWSVW